MTNVYRTVIDVYRTVTNVYGTVIDVSRTVTNENDMPVARARLDVWQTNHDGFYDVQQPDLQPDMNMRGSFVTDENGRYHYVTVRPIS